MPVISRQGSRRVCLVSRRGMKCDADWGLAAGATMRKAAAGRIHKIIAMNINSFQLFEEITSEKTKENKEVSGKCRRC